MRSSTLNGPVRRQLMERGFCCGCAGAQGDVSGGPPVPPIAGWRDFACSGEGEQVRWARLSLFLK